MEICSSHYNEDIEWLKKSPWPVSVVHKEGGAPIDNATWTIPNVGCEASAYLTYIVNRYETLPEYVAFIHGHEEAYHQNGDRPLLDLIRDANVKKYGYVPLNNTWRCVNTRGQMGHLPLFIELPPLFTMCANAQFVVSRGRILQHPKSTYELLLRLADSYERAVVFEMTWHIFFADGFSLKPHVDDFDPPLTEVRYATASSVPMTVAEIKLAYLGKNPPPDVIPIVTQSDYDYWEIRGVTFCIQKGDEFIDIKFDKNKYFPYTEDLINQLKSIVSQFEAL